MWTTATGSWFPTLPLRISHGLRLPDIWPALLECVLITSLPRQNGHLVRPPTPLPFGHVWCCVMLRAVTIFLSPLCLTSEARILHLHSRRLLIQSAVSWIALTTRPRMRHRFRPLPPTRAPPLFCLLTEHVIAPFRLHQRLAFLRTRTTFLSKKHGLRHHPRFSTLYPSPGRTKTAFFHATWMIFVKWTSRILHPYLRTDIPLFAPRLSQPHRPPLLRTARAIRGTLLTC